MKQMRGTLPTLLALAALAAGCASRPPLPEPPAGQRLAECRQLLGRVDAVVADAGVGDAQSARVAGFQQLRVNRYLAAEPVKPAPQDPAFGAWTGRLAALAAEARRVELANLPAEAAQDLPPRPALQRQVEACRDRLTEADLGSPERRHALRAAARVPPEYQTWKRVAGLYPLTALAFRAGIERWHADTHETFGVPLDALPVSGRLLRYRPPAGQRLSREQLSAILGRSTDNPLGIPDPRGEDRARLLHHFAPVLEVDTAGPGDRVGRPYLIGRRQAEVHRHHPVVYTHVSHARLGGRSLLQLNYVFWFPARRLTGPLDLLGGELDGITWRVTLDPSGRPLLWDTMHNCGCYHMFIPDRTALRQVNDGGIYQEPPLVPQTLSDPALPLVLRIAHHTHYLQRVYPDSAAGPPEIPYELADYQQLRSLPLPGGGRASLFRPDGIVPGSERRERWLFWPMGVPLPGAMRQWGHHATAFVGRRHFDDPDLVERYFRLRQTP